MDNKGVFRAHCCQIRDALSREQITTASTQVCDHLAAWPLFCRAEVVMTYMAFRNEIDLGRLLADFPAKRWVIPRIVNQPQPHMTLHTYNPQRLVRHRFGMLEPDPNLPTVPPGELELILTPGLAYDRRGYRLGLGGGFYDRFLPGVKAPAAGIVHSALIVEAVPAEAHDQRVDYLVCENGILQTKIHGGEKS